VVFNLYDPPILSVAILYSLSITGNVFSKEGRQKQLEHAGGLVTEGEEGEGEENVSTNLWTESSSVGPVEDVSEDFLK
jgi:hypothetical protein